MKTINKIADQKAIESLLVTVPAGKVSMRDDRTKETWSETISPFRLSQFPVTQQLYSAVTHENPSTFKGDQLPVETVSWIDAVNFCNELSVLLGKTKCYSVDLKTEKVRFHPDADGFRLPTEAEWQYACQTGKHVIRYGALEDVAWFKENSGDKTHAVGEKLPNDWQLYDMLGNVWEWCSDIYDETVYGTYRVFRGGGWCDQARSVMATTRRRSHPFSFKIDDLGFRIATKAAQ